MTEKIVLSITWTSTSVILTTIQVKANAVRDVSCCLFNGKHNISNIG